MTRFRLALRLCAALALAPALAPRALAQAVPDPLTARPPEQKPQAPPPLPVTPPAILGEQPQAEYPPAELAQGRTARVVIELEVTEQGEARNARVVSPPQPGFDESALAVAPRLRFSPAKQGETPIAVRIQFAVNFAPPALQRAPESAVQQPVNLAGQVRERGTRRKLGGLEVAVPAAGIAAFTDAQGRFALRGVPPGSQEVVIAAPGYERFAVKEAIEPGK